MILNLILLETGISQRGKIGIHVEVEYLGYLASLILK
jgi:hypothetical protein